MARRREEGDFQAALAHFGFTQPAILAIVANGLTISNDLIGIETKDIENIMKILRTSTVPPMMVPYMAQKRLNTLCYWVNRRHRLLESIDIIEFTPEAADAFGRLMAFETQEEDTSTVKPPSEFQQGSKWKAFKEGAIAFFNFV
jgi:hypothetical protein